MGYAVVSKTTARKGLRVRIPPPASPTTAADRISRGGSPGRGSAARADLPTLEGMIKTYAYFQSIIAGLRDHERGQTMAEYAVVLAVITVAIVGTLAFLAGGIKSTLNSVTSKL